MKRKIYSKLLDWKVSEHGRTALLIDGVRRVGKSWIVEEFARREYKSHLIIDFGKVSKEIKRIFNDYLGDLDTFFMYLLGEFGVRLERRESLIVFDEVQKFPRAREAIKYLVADGRYDYIETGSLISIQKNVKNIVIPSEERHLEMHPMDFEEFLWAMGQEMTMPLVENAFGLRRPLGEGTHRRIMDFYRQYLIVGGMPQAVRCFAETHDLGEVDKIKRDIINLYRADILKHGGISKHKILAVFNAIPASLARHEWRFSPGEVKPGTGMREFEASFEWLKSSMMVNIAYNSAEPNIGLELSADHHVLKCYLADTGLLISMAFTENELVADEIQQRLLTGRLEVNGGMLAENLVAQMLRAAGQQLYFHVAYNRDTGRPLMEIDFLVARNNLMRRHNISPIEVKSAGKYATHSMERFLSKYEAYAGTAYVLHPKDVKQFPDRIALPLYMAGLVMR